nr:FAD-dependent oxidoreductase [uncultured Rhodopila sp.]
MTTRHFDIAVIGAGMAGASAAAFLSADRTVVLIEAEDAAGYHTTGRSAAMWIESYGPPGIRALTRQSRRFLEAPPAGFAGTPLIRFRPMLLVATPDQRADLEAALAAGPGLRRLANAEAEAMVPALRPGYLGGAALEDAFDIEVAALHQGFLRMHRANGGVVALRSRAGRIERRGSAWEVETACGDRFTAPVVVNAAGAWGDAVARLAGAAPVGLEPRRRSVAIIDPAPAEVSGWPMIIDVNETWYARPEARTRLLVSPADATPVHPHDVQPEELDIATGIDRMQRALDITVRRVERKWAGLRTFTPDGSPALGWDRRTEGFFWCVGQGGYGIQTAPAAGRLTADLVIGRDPGEAAATGCLFDPGRFDS